MSERHVSDINFHKILTNLYKFIFLRILFIHESERCLAPSERRREVPQKGLGGDQYTNRDTANIKSSSISLTKHDQVRIH